MKIAAWLVFAVAFPGDASQTITAIPFASFQYCERHMDRVSHDLSRFTVKPFCTSIAPSFWVAPKESF